MMGTMIDSNGCVVTVHGVGVTKPGDTLEGFVAYFSDTYTTYYQTHELITCGKRFPFRTSPDPMSPDLYEVNWADVQRPTTNWISAFSHLARILIGMLHFADYWTDSSGKSRWLLTAYRLLFELATIWGVPFITFIMALTSVDQRNAWLVTSIGTCLIAVSTIYTRGWSTPLLIGGIAWTILYLVIGTTVCWGGKSLYEPIIRLASSNYVSRHHILPFVVAALFVFTMIPRAANKGTWEQRLTRFGLTYLPLLGVAIVGACLWVLIIPLISNSSGFAYWQDIHSRVLAEKQYNLKAAELLHFGVITFLGCIALIVAAIYLKRRFQGSVQAGIGARNALPVLIWFIPVGLMIVSFALFTDIPSAMFSADDSVYNIYKISALRALPFLPWLLTPMVIVLDVVGDVIFLALPPGNKLSIRRETSERMKAILDHAVSHYQGSIIVLAHSLGSIIALRELSIRGDRDRFILITVGAPVSSLHERFLGWSVDQERGFLGHPKNWLNIYRYGDYVGGEIPGLSKENNLFIGKRSTEKLWDAYDGHIKYWEDPEVIKALLQRLTKVT